MMTHSSSLITMFYMSVFKGKAYTSTSRGNNSVKMGLPAFCKWAYSKRKSFVPLKMLSFSRRPPFQKGTGIQ